MASPAGWQTWGGSLGSVSSPVRSGSRAGRFEGDGSSTKWFYQSVAVSGGATYAFDAWIQHDDPGAASAFLRVSWYTSDDAQGASLSSADSTERLTAPAPGFRHLTTGPTTAPPDARSARLRIVLAPSSDGLAAIVADDATFMPTVPDPAGVSPEGANSSSPSSPVTRLEDEGPASSAQIVQGSATAVPAASRVVLNEVMYDPGTAGGSEWVELYNAGDAPVDLRGWSISDAAGRDDLRGTQLGPRQFIVIAASDSIRTTFPEFEGQLIVLGGRLGNALGNDGDSLQLVDPTGAVVDAISWGWDRSVLDPPILDVPAGHSIERRTAGADSDSANDWADTLSPSPGGPRHDTAVLGERRNAATGPVIDIASSRRELVPGWLPWTIASASGLALAAAIGWRVLPVVRRRLHFGE